MDGIRPERNIHMTKLILKMSVSLDGFVARTDGRNDWIFPSMSDDAAAWTLDAVWQASAHLMGAENYRAMAAYWPQSSEIFAAPMNEIPKVVFSKTLTAADWGETSIASGDLGEEVKRLKQGAGGDLVAHGGTRSAQSLCKSGL